MTEDATHQPAPIQRETIALAVGEASVRLKVAVAGTAEPVFCLGVRKSGSSMFNRLVHFLAQRNGIAIVDIPGSFFKQGLTSAHWADLDLTPLVRPGNLYSGFRNYPAKLAGTEIFRQARKVFMFRDPRDALVSQYYSDAYTHSLPSAQTESGAEGRAAFEKKRAEALAADIDAWVLQKAGGMRKTMLDYAGLLDDPLCRALRYEDYVFQKRRLARKVCEQFGWTLERAPLEGFMAEIDIVPEGEDTRRFVRRAVPGDHNAKLKPETIRRLDRVLAEVLVRYDYG